MTGAERGRILRRVAALLRERNDELARLEVLDTGKPIQEASAVDIASGADCLEYFAGLAAGLAGEHIDLGAVGLRLHAPRAARRRAPASAPGTIRSRSPAGSRRRRSPAATR